MIRLANPCYTPSPLSHPPPPPPHLHPFIILPMCSTAQYSICMLSCSFRSSSYFVKTVYISPFNCVIISAAAVHQFSASTSIHSLYIHPQPLHPPSASTVPPSSASTPILGTASPVLSLYIQLQPPCPSSASTTSASTSSASTSSASTPILSLYIQPQPHSCLNFCCIFSLVKTLICELM